MSSWTRCGLLSSRRATLAAALTTLLLASAANPSAASATPRDARLRHVHTWAFAIGDGDLAGNLAVRYAPYDLIVFDGVEARASQIRALRRAGKIVLGYLDVGTIERGRPWFRRARAYRLDYWPDWGEWYANTNARGYRALIAQTVAPSLLSKGFDGLFLDNTDMVETHPRQKRGLRALVAALAGLTHRHGALLFAQNGEDSIGPLLKYYDGWNREDVTSTYDFSRKRYVRQPPSDVRDATTALRRMAGKGLLPLSTDYTAANDSASAANSVANACAAGAIPFVSDIELTRIPPIAPRCPG
jgi:endo-alpha-1,4-polygalactosaminidase (GH114 family)